MLSQSLYKTCILSREPKILVIEWSFSVKIK